MFTKSDLETGHMVQYRNGNYALVMKDCFNGDRLIQIKDGSWMPLEEYDKKLKCSSSDFDIVKVFGNYYVSDVLMSIINKTFPDNFKAIYERNDPEEQLKNIINNLEKQLEEHKEELRKLGGN